MTGLSAIFSHNISRKAEEKAYKNRHEKQPIKYMLQRPIN